MKTSHPSRLFFAITLLPILLLFFMYLFVSDRTTFGEYITIWPSFFWCLGLAPLIAATWNRKERWRFLTLAAALLLFLGMTVEWLPFHLLSRRPAQSGKQLRIVSWNINSGSGGMDRLLGMLEPYAPDVCFFQETPDDKAHIAKNSEFFANYKWIDAGDCGLLSRYPMRSLPTRSIGPWSPPQMALLELPDQESILLVNVRLMLPSLVLNPLSNEARRTLAEDHRKRLAQYWELVKLISEARMQSGASHVILAGDFNTPGRMYSLSPLERLPLADVWPESGRNWGATMTAQFPVSRIDQCWVSPRLLPTKSEVILGEPSDHRALMVDLLVE